MATNILNKSNLDIPIMPGSGQKPDAVMLNGVQRSTAKPVISRCSETRSQLQTKKSVLNLLVEPKMVRQMGHVMRQLITQTFRRKS